MPVRFLNGAAEHIAPCLTYVCNLSIESGRVPKDLKLAMVIPLYYKGSKLEEGNYRPVSHQKSFLDGPNEVATQSFVTTYDCCT